MILLAIETATRTCGVAVADDENVLAQAHLHRPRVHSERLTPLVEDVLSHAGAPTEKVDAVAVSMGPGSYTGLRIGVSTAKAWALAAEASLVGVPTLEAFAARLEPVANPGDVACVLLDARRDEVYAGAYRFETEGLTSFAPTKALSVDALSAWLGSVDSRLWLLGDGGGKSLESLTDIAEDRTVVPFDTWGPSAAWVARRGRHKLRVKGPDDLASFEPFYVKDVHATPAASPFG